MEEKRTRTKRKIKIPPIYYVVGGIILLMVIIALYIYYHPSYSTQVVYHGSEEEIISGKAILVLDEEILSSSSKGMAVMNYSDGTRVTARTHVATVYSGEIDEGKKQSIRSLSEKINLYKKKHAKFTSIGVMLYILGAAIFLAIPGVAAVTNKGDISLCGLIGLIILLIFVAVATGLIVFVNMSIPQDVAPYFVKKEDVWLDKSTKKGSIIGMINDIFPSNNSSEQNMLLFVV